MSPSCILRFFTKCFPRSFRLCFYFSTICYTISWYSYLSAISVNCNSRISFYAPRISCFICSYSFILFTSFICIANSQVSSISTRSNYNRTIFFCSNCRFVGTSKYITCSLITRITVTKPRLSFNLRTYFNSTRFYNKRSS